MNLRKLVKIWILFLFALLVMLGISIVIAQRQYKEIAGYRRAVEELNGKADNLQRGYDDITEQLKRLEKK